MPALALSIDNNEITTVASTGATTINKYFTNIKRFDKVRVQLATTGTNIGARFDFNTNTSGEIAVKPYILESNSTLVTGVDYKPYINPNEADLVYTPVPTVDANNCIDCDTKLPQYIPERNPNYSILETHNYHILPIIKTNHKYCGITYDKNKQVFFNGNIVNINQFDSGKTYLSKDDELEILSYGMI